MNFKGDVNVSRTGQFGRRANQGLYAPAQLVADYTADINDYAWLQIDGDGNDVLMPDATTLTLGWSIVIENVGATAIAVTDNAAGALKTILNPASPNDTAAYQFVCTGIGSAAGTWYVIELGDAALVAVKVFAEFASGDFPAAVGGYRTLTATQLPTLGVATHGRGATPIFQVEEGASGGPYDRVFCDQERISATGDITLRVTDGAEFAGAITIV